MHFVRKIPLLCLFTLVMFSLSCTSQEYVRHLASDACLITPQHSTKENINAYLGPPDKKQALADNGEEWTYLQQNKSLLRKTPYVGDKLGSEHYDVMVIVFRGEIVEACQYRMLTKEEFEKAHLDTGPKPDAD